MIWNELFTFLIVVFIGMNASEFIDILRTCTLAVYEFEVLEFEFGE